MVIKKLAGKRNLKEKPKEQNENVKVRNVHQEKSNILLYK